MERLFADWLLDTHVWVLCLELYFSWVLWTLTSLCVSVDMPTVEKWLNDVIAMEYSGYLNWPQKYLPGEQCLTSSWECWRLSEKVMISFSYLTITRYTAVTANPVCLIQQMSQARGKRKTGKEVEAGRPQGTKDSNWRLNTIRWEQVFVCLEDKKS